MLPLFEQDHTGAFKDSLDGVDTPELQVAANDYAIGRLVEAVARSRYASDTLIFIVEDDCQDGPDHVDAHRSIAFVVGPYVRQGAVVSTRYSTVNMLRTMEDILGLDHISLDQTETRGRREPIERHAVLYFIEQGLMTRTGKRYEWELGVESGIPLMATIQDYDWADEVLHAALGREWYIPQFGDRKEALDYGDACWSKILSNWHTVRDQGLTRHENWWPAIYLQACANWGIQPDEKVLAFNDTYEGQRADLKTVSVSA